MGDGVFVDDSHVDSFGAAAARDAQRPSSARRFPQTGAIIDPLIVPGKEAERRETAMGVSHARMAGAPATPAMLLCRRLKSTTVGHTGTPDFGADI
jgi:hypothetical protein